MSMEYLVIFAASVLVDTLPVLGPPAWVFMVFMQVNYGLGFWGALAACVLGTTLGRYFQLLYLPRMANCLLKRYKTEDLEFLGRKLGQSIWRCWGFVLLHAVTPLPTTALFTAAALGKVAWYRILVPFFVAKAISDGIILASGVYVASTIGGLKESVFSFKTIAGALGAVALIILLFSVDWRLLLQHRKLALRFKIWR